LALNACTPENSTNDPPALIRPAKCFASIVGPITLVSNDSCRLARSRSASVPRALAEAVDTMWSMCPTRSASAAIDSSSVMSTVSAVTSGSSYAAATNHQDGLIFKRSHS
jgi:hypothetical protein